MKKVTQKNRNYEIVTQKNRKKLEKDTQSCASIRNSNIIGVDPLGLLYGRQVGRSALQGTQNTPESADRHYSAFTALLYGRQVGRSALQDNQNTPMW